MAERRQRAENPGIACQHVETAVALIEREREPRDAVAILHIQRHQRGGAAGGLDLVVDLLQPAHRARHGHHVRAGLGELQSERRANAARGAGDQCDTVREGFVGHSPVMPGLVPGIHAFRFLLPLKDVDGRDKPGHDAKHDRLDRLRQQR